MNSRIYFILYFVFAQAARADGMSIRDVCLSQAQIQKRVYNCGDNALAAKIAQSCADFVFGRWSENAPAFEAAVQKSLADSGGGQKDSLKRSQLNYQMNSDVLDVKLAFFGKYADLIASYPLIMMDSLRGKDDETSAPCFNSAFHSVENTVSRLDREIVNTLHAKARLSALDSDLGNRVVAVNSSLGSEAVASPLISSGFKGAKSEDPQSDITGTSKDRRVSSTGQGNLTARPGSSRNAGAKNAAPASDPTAAAARQIPRNSEASAVTGDNAGWAGTKVGQEIFSELENSKTDSDPAKKDSEIGSAALPSGHSLPKGADAAQPGDVANGREKLNRSLGSGENGEVEGDLYLSSSESNPAAADSIFSPVSRKYRQMESLLKK